MDNSITLSSLTDRASYAAHFMDHTLWEPYVRQVCDGPEFDCYTIRPGVPGTYPTFMVELKSKRFQQPREWVVVKFFGPLFDGVGSFRIERDMGRWLEAQSLPIPSPAILAEGQLNQDWQYVIFEHVAGVSIGQALDKLSKDDRLSVASQMGEYMHCLHTLTADPKGNLPMPIPPSLERFTSFLQQQCRTCLTHHQTWNDLPAHLFDQLEEFVLPAEQLIDFSASPYLIHADLTADHLLGRFVNDRWQTLSVIDWGDTMTGNLFYELVALSLDLFQGDKQMLHACLEAYQLPDFYQQDFSKKALSMVLLHQFPMPARFYAPYQHVQSLQELAECMFAV
jgi:hygromycin-B 7''-O-kinase